MTDNALMARVGAGELAKLAVLFERHHRGLFRYLVSMNRNRDLSEDLVQDVFFRILRYRTTYNSAQSFTAWMYQIARRASLDRAQKQRAEVVGIDGFGDRRAHQVAGSNTAGSRHSTIFPMDIVSSQPRRRSSPVPDGLGQPM